MQFKNFVFPRNKARELTWKSCDSHVNLFTIMWLSHDFHVISRALFLGLAINILSISLYYLKRSCPCLLIQCLKSRKYLLWCVSHINRRATVFSWNREEPVFSTYFSKLKGCKFSPLETPYHIWQVSPGSRAQVLSPTGQPTPGSNPTAGKLFSTLSDIHEKLLIFHAN